MDPHSDAGIIQYGDTVLCDQRPIQTTTLDGEVEEAGKWMSYLDDNERRAMLIWLAKTASLADIPELIRILQNRYCQLAGLGHNLSPPLSPRSDGGQELHCRSAKGSHARPSLQTDNTLSLSFQRETLLYSQFGYTADSPKLKCFKIDGPSPLRAVPSLPTPTSALNSSLMHYDVSCSQSRREGHAEWLRQWPKSRRLHKYHECLVHLPYETLLELDEDTMKIIGIDTVGARTKLCKVRTRNSRGGRSGGVLTLLQGASRVESIPGVATQLGRLHQSCLTLLCFISSDR